MKILFTGGGTAGHIFPIIAVSREIRKLCSDKNLKFFYLGPNDDFGETLLSQEGIKIRTISAGKVRRYSGIKGFFQNLIDVLFKIPIGFFQALFYIFVISPDLIFSKGGYGSIPVVFAGWILLVPVFLHESDIAPGLANRLLAKFSLEIFVSFPVEKTEVLPPSKMICVGNPVRNEILEGSAERARELFNLTGEKPVVLVLGGSQGAQKINDLILEILPDMLKDFEVIHQCGEKNFHQVQAEAEIMIDIIIEKYYHLFPFLDEEKLKHAYKIADVIISRAGSGSIFEISTVEKPSILIPISKSAQNHQIKNAYAYAESGACIVIEEVNLTPHFFLEKLKYLFSQPEKLKEMVNNTRLFSKSQAARIIAEYIVEYLTQ